jgi:hypothetical protein
VIDNAEGTIAMTMRADGSCPRQIAFDPGLGVWYDSPVWRPERALSEAERRCRPSPRRPHLVPLGGNLSLEQARAFRRFRLYWVGRRYQEFVLSSISQGWTRGPRGRGPVVHLGYGVFQLQLWPACVRVPADVDLPSDGSLRIRGAEAVLFEGGGRLEIVTGKATIVVFAPPGRIVRIAKNLRPISAASPPSSGYRFPPPARGAASGRLRCGS